MLIKQWIDRNVRMNIHTYMKISYRLKSMKGEQKKQILSGMNINV